MEQAGGLYRVKEKTNKKRKKKCNKQNSHYIHLTLKVMGME